MDAVVPWWLHQPVTLNSARGSLPAGAWNRVLGGSSLVWSRGDHQATGQPAPPVPPPSSPI